MNREPLPSLLGFVGAWITSSVLVALIMFNDTSGLQSATYALACLFVASYFSLICLVLLGIPAFLFCWWLKAVNGWSAGICGGLIAFAAAFVSNGGVFELEREMELTAAGITAGVAFWLARSYASRFAAPVRSSGA